jgi:hypothetical protein
MAEDFEPSETATKQLRKTLEAAGFFIHNFAAVELLVVAWLLSLSETRAQARRYLKKEQHLAQRVKQLRRLVAADAALASSGLIKEIDDIEPLRIFRNQVAHAPAGVDRNNAISLVGFKKTIAVSPQIMSAHSARAARIMQQLNAYHIAKFGVGPALRTAAEAAPPPID